MDYDDFHRLGYLAYTNDGPRAAIQHQEVADALQGRQVGDPVTMTILRAFNAGWAQAADQEAYAVLQDHATHQD